MAHLRHGQQGPGLFNTGVFKCNKSTSNRSNRAITSNEKLTRKRFTSGALMTVQANHSHALTQATSTGKFSSNPTSPCLLVSLTNWGQSCCIKFCWVCFVWGCCHCLPLAGWVWHWGLVPFSCHWRMLSLAGLGCSFFPVCWGNNHASTN